jgi:hypothetical protein
MYVYIVKLSQLNMNIHTCISLAMDGGVWTGDGLCACYLKIFKDWGGVRPSLMVRPGPDIGPCLQEYCSGPSLNLRCQELVSTSSLSHIYWWGTLTNLANLLLVQGRLSVYQVIPDG